MRTKEQAISVLRNAVARLTAEALKAGASPAQILDAVGTGIDETAQRHPLVEAKRDNAA